MNFKRGELIPDATIVDAQGISHRLWDWRQKSHLVLLVAPEASPAQRVEWQRTIDRERAQWVWLHAEVLLLKEGPAQWNAGVYAIDRYGRFLKEWPIDQWSAEDLQREYIYHEARHC